MAPEVVRERYTLSADLWSAGVMAYLLLTGRLPFPFWDRMYVQRQVSGTNGMLLLVAAGGCWCCRKGGWMPGALPLPTDSTHPSPKPTRR